MTWLSTWLENNQPKYAVHASESAAEENAKAKRAGGRDAVHFWSEVSEEPA